MVVLSYTFIFISLSIFAMLAIITVAIAYNIVPVYAFVSEKFKVDVQVTY